MCLLIVRESRGARRSLDSFIDDRFTAFDLLFMDSLHFLSLELDFLLLFNVLHFHDQSLVLFEVNAIKSDKRWNPNAESCSELFVLKVILENRIARIFHKV